MTEKDYTEINWLKISKKLLMGWCWIYKEDVDTRFYTMDNYIAECKTQGLTPLTVEHLKQIWLTEERSEENKAIADKLGLKMSGYVDPDGTWSNTDDYGYLSSASPVDNDGTRAFKFYKDEGRLYKYYNRNYARTCLYLVEDKKPRYDSDLDIEWKKLNIIKMLNEMIDYINSTL